MIISASIDQESNNIVSELEKQGFSGRSEIIRNALKMLWDDHQNKSNLKGTIDAVLLVKHNEKNSEAITKIRHQFQNLIQTNLHVHLENHHCLELFILKGQAEQIKKLTKSLETSKKTTLVKLIIS
jgi:CopG family nickel-responsive transcriptional regulator